MFVLPFVVNKDVYNIYRTI